MRLSFTAVSDFLNCPSLFYRRKIKGEEPEEIPVFTRGKQMHEVMEKFYTDVNEKKAMQDWKPTSPVEVAFKLREYTDAEHQKEASMMACLVFNEYMETGAMGKHEVEMELTIESVLYNFIGYVDRIRFLPNGKAVLIDYKTGKNKPEKLEKYARQLGLYSSIFEITSGVEVEYVELQWIDYGEKTKMTLTPEYKEECLAWYLEAKRNIENMLQKGETFVEKKGTHCYWCGYKRSCPAWNKW